jgi:multiple sugar transport system substrate-binding protein
MRVGTPRSAAQPRPRDPVRSVLAAASVALAALAGAVPARAAPPRPVSIVYWAGHASGALHRAVEAEVAEFNRTHPGIHVSFHAIGASKHGLAAFAAGQAPNVAMVSSYVVPNLVRAHAILNLQPYIDGPHGLTASEIARDYYPVVWNDMVGPAGGRYMMPLEKKTLLVIYYNRDLFRRAGISAPPRTWAQLGADAARIAHLGPRLHGIAWTPRLSQFFDLVLADGGHVFAAGRPRRRFDLVNPGAEEALAMLRGWVRSGAMVLTTGYQYQLDFGTGNVGALIDASAGYTYDKASVGGKFPVGAVAAPAGSAGEAAQYVNGASLVMFAVGSPAQRAASWTFVKWMSSPPTNAYWNTHTNYVPLGPAAYRLMQPFYRAHPNWAASYTDPAHWWYKPRAAAGTYRAAAANMMTPWLKGLRGQLPVAQALQQMTQVGNAYLSGRLRG